MYVFCIIKSTKALKKQCIVSGQNNLNPFASKSSELQCVIVAAISRPSVPVRQVSGVDATLFTVPFNRFVLSVSLNTYNRYESFNASLSIVTGPGEQGLRAAEVHFEPINTQDKIVSPSDKNTRNHLVAS